MQSSSPTSTVYNLKGGKEKILPCDKLLSSIQQIYTPPHLSHAHLYTRTNVLMRSRCCDGFVLERGGEYLLATLQLRRIDGSEKETEMSRLLMFPQIGKKGP